MANSKITKIIESRFTHLENKIEALEEFLELTKWEIDDYLEYLEENLEKSTAERKNLLKKFLPEAEKKYGRETIELLAKEEVEEEHKFRKNTLPQFIYQSFLSLLWSQLEGLLDSLVKLLEKEQGPKPFKEDLKIPRINILLRRINNYGLVVDLDPSLERQIHKIRRVRNKFIHSLGGEIAEDLSRETAKNLAVIKKESDINHQFCLNSLKIVKPFVQKVKEAFEKKYK